MILSKEQRQYNGANVAFSTNSAGTTAHDKKTVIYTQILYSSHKLTQKDYRLNVKLVTLTFLEDKQEKT